MNSARTNYSSVARLYDALGYLYSGGQISAAKIAQIKHISAGDRVLYAGVGGGEDALLAARAGAEVTAVDLSQAMLDQTARVLKSAGMSERVELICDDIMCHDRAEGYDVVIANFFLNVFDESLMPEVTRHLTTLLKPGGLFLVADFKPLASSLVERTLQRIYFGCANAVFRIIANNPWHPIYDYAPHLTRCGLNVSTPLDLKIFGWGPSWYRVWRAEKLAERHAERHADRHAEDIQGSSS